MGACDPQGPSAALTNSSSKALPLSLAVGLLFLDLSHVLGSSDLGLEEAERKLLVFTFFCFHRLLPLPREGVPPPLCLSAKPPSRGSLPSLPLASSTQTTPPPPGFSTGRGGLLRAALSPALSLPVSLLGSETPRCIMANQSARKWLGTIRFVKAFRETIYFL